MSQPSSKSSPSNLKQSNVTQTRADAHERAAFVVRLWRAPGEPWRCRLIHVETGCYLPCDSVDEVSVRIEEWLARTDQASSVGLR